MCNCRNPVKFYKLTGSDSLSLSEVLAYMVVVIVSCCVFFKIQAGAGTAAGPVAVGRPCAWQLELFLIGPGPLWAVRLPCVRVLRGGWLGCFAGICLIMITDQ